MAMKRRKMKLKYKKERVVFSDVLPYEIPLIFSNRYFYRFLVSNEIFTDCDKLKWNPNINDGAFLLLKWIFNIDTTKTKEDGEANIEKKMIKIPLVYKISHKEMKHRELTVIHPANQIKVIEFYEKYKYLILEYCKQSSFSLRKPNKVACYFYYKDRMHKQLLGKKADKIEMFFNEYENLRTYFSYKKYSNVYKFYEDYRYQRAEKKFNYLLKFDIQSCFDSIYTHSIVWATSGGKDMSKQRLNVTQDYIKQTFGNQFDILMQRMNYNETNGIIIGPEFSRIFAEIILQHIDKTVEFNLSKKHHIYKNKSYECYRYVDDYFLFFNKEEEKQTIIQEFIEGLKEFKLCIGDSKTELFSKPFITGITQAKIKIDILLKENLNFIDYGINEDNEIIDTEIDDENIDIQKQEIIQNCLIENRFLYINPNTFNTKFKSIIKECDVAYKNVSNYTLACFNAKLERVLRKFDKSYKLFSLASFSDNIDDDLKERCNQRKKKEEKMLTQYIVNLLDIAFFLYSNNKRINTTLKLLSILNIIILYFKNNYETESIKRFSDNSRNEVFKKIQDEIYLIMQSTPFNETTQLESLYLLIALKELGSEYRISKDVINNYLGIKYNYAGVIEYKPKFNIFAIIILMYYYGNSKQYEDSKQLLIESILKKYEEIAENKINQHAEFVILTLDILACPYISNTDKKLILEKNGFKESYIQDSILSFTKKQKYWFTKWTGLNLNRELNAKISQEVYS
jgi:hypothetical protein